MVKPITIPLLNPNEPEAMVAALYIHEGQHVSAGELVATLETTKSVADLTAEADGFITGLQTSQGQTVRAGELLCLLADQPGEIPAVVKIQNPPSPAAPGLRATQPALALAHQLGIELSNLPVDRLVTESIVREIAGSAREKLSPRAGTSTFDPGEIIIYGGGGHGKALIDLLRLLRIYPIVGIVDDGLARDELILDIPVLGGSEVLSELQSQGIHLAVNAVGGIGDITTRIQVFHRLGEAGFACPAVVHPTAFIEASASLAAGAQVFAQSYVGSSARVGFGCIVNTGAVISHDCVLGDYANISPGALLAGEVEIGTAALVGMGATINLGVHIGAGARVGNGATVKEDIPDKGIVRAGTTWK